MTRLRFRPPAIERYLTSFLFLLDLKVGATIITLFALFNKIAGVFGIIAVFQGGTLAQISLYLYSIASIVLFLWALRGIADEDAARTLRYAHAFLADHMLSTAWTLLFALGVYVYQPHDGQKPQLAAHQAGLMDLIEGIEKSYETPGTIKHHVPLEGEERVKAAQQVWNEEKNFSASVLGAGWLLKIYFTLILYSFAIHLRHGTYRNLPLSKSAGSSSANSAARLRGGYRPLRGTSFQSGVADEEELPAWSDDEEEAQQQTAGATAATGPSAAALESVAARQGADTR